MTLPFLGLVLNTSLEKHKGTAIYPAQTETSTRRHS